jgi:hypothetical protein
VRETERGEAFICWMSRDRRPILMGAKDRVMLPGVGEERYW